MLAIIGIGAVLLIGLILSLLPSLSSDDERATSDIPRMDTDSEFDMEDLFQNDGQVAYETNEMPIESYLEMATDTVSLISSSTGDQMIIDSLVYRTKYLEYVIDSLLAYHSAKPKPKPIRRRVTTSKPKPVTKVDDEETKYLNYTFPNQSTSNSSEGTQRFFDARFLQDEIVDLDRDQTILIRNTSKIVLSNGKTIPKNTSMKGVISVTDKRLSIHIYSVETYDEIINVHLAAYHSDFKPGLPLSRAEDIFDDESSDINNIKNDAIKKTQVTIPVIGTTVGFGSLANKRSQKIFFPASFNFKLKVLTP